ncbi:hypothetical protein [Helicobacter sp. 23-1045]
MHLDSANFARKTQNLLLFFHRFCTFGKFSLPFAESKTKKSQNLAHLFAKKIAESC